MCSGCRFVHMEDGSKIPAPENQNGPLIVAIPVSLILLALAVMTMTWPGLFPWCRP